MNIGWMNGGTNGRIDGKNVVVIFVIPYSIGTVGLRNKRGYIAVIVNDFNLWHAAIGIRYTMLSGLVTLAL